MLWSLYLRRRGIYSTLQKTFCLKIVLNIKLKGGIIFSYLENSLLCNASCLAKLNTWSVEELIL